MNPSRKEPMSYNSHQGNLLQERNMLQKTKVLTCTFVKNGKMEHIQFTKQDLN